MSELHIPSEVADAMQALRPELRKKLSLRDIDDMTRPLRDRIRELETELSQERDLCCRAFADSERAIREAEKLAYDLKCLEESTADKKAFDQMKARAEKAEAERDRYREWMSGWLKYDADTSDCPDCDLCGDDGCFHRQARILVEGTDEQ